MRRAWIEQARWWMLSTQRIPGLAGLYRRISLVAMWIAGRRLLQVRGVTAVYSRHTHPRSLAFVPGHSDIDLTVVLDDNRAHDPQAIRECGRTVRELDRRFLFIKAEDTRFMSDRELGRLTRTYASPSEFLCRPEDWLLIAGREVRTSTSLPFPAHLVPRHPEFNKWWENIIQTQIFRPDRPLQEGYMRSLYRSAIKNQMHLEAARGLTVSKPAGLVGDELEELKFTENPRLQEILRTIKERNLWTDSPERRKPELFLEVLKATANFFAEGRALRQPDGSPSARLRPVSEPVPGPDPGGRPRRAADPHRLLYQALSKKIGETPALTDFLQSAVAYPLPHAYPYTYRVDLVLREDMSAEEFGGACQALKRNWGRKNLALAGAPVEFTLIPAGVYREALFFLGSACPFLLEHVHEFGATVHGPEHTYAPLGWSRADLVEWCRIYLPYHMVTFRRRPEYASPVLNFCQLASLLIFLERGDRLTDPLDVQRRYVSEFVRNEEDRETVDRLVCRPGELSNPAQYDRALACISDIYDRLEHALAA